jgi:hypothetical protein
MRRTPPIKRLSSQDESEEELYKKKAEKGWKSFIMFNFSYFFDQPPKMLGKIHVLLQSKSN